MDSRKFLLVAVLATSLMVADVGAEAFSVPVSNYMVKGQLEMTDGEIIQFAVLDGAMLKVRNPDEGYFVGLTPVIKKEGGEQVVSFTVFNIAEHGPGLHSLKEEGTFETRPGEKSAMVAPFYAEVSLLGIEKSSLSQGDVDKMRRNMMPNKLFAKDGFETGADQGGGISTECCVTCGSTTACGCAVSMSCGDCCDSQCCGGGHNGPLQDSPTP